MLAPVALPAFRHSEGSVLEWTCLTFARGKACSVRGGNGPALAGCDYLGRPGGPRVHGIASAQLAAPAVAGQPLRLAEEQAQQAEDEANAHQRGPHAEH